MNHRITDYIEYVIAVLAWHYDTCRSAGVIRCVLDPSYMLQPHAIRDHMLSSVHSKHSSEPVKSMIDDYQQRIKHMLLCVIYLCTTMQFDSCCVHLTTLLHRISR